MSTCFYQSRIDVLVLHFFMHTVLPNLLICSTSYSFIYLLYYNYKTGLNQLINNYSKNMFLKIHCHLSVEIINKFLFRNFTTFIILAYYLKNFIIINLETCQIVSVKIFLQTFFGLH